MQDIYAKYWGSFWVGFLLLFVFGLGIFAYACGHYVYGEPFKLWGKAPIAGRLYQAAIIIGAASVLGGIPLAGPVAHWWIVVYLVWPWLYRQGVGQSWVLLTMGLVGTSWACWQGTMLEAGGRGGRVGLTAFLALVSLAVTAFLYFFLPGEWRVMLRGY